MVDVASVDGVDEELQMYVLDFAQAVLDLVGPDLELSVLLTDDEGIAPLNEEYRGKHGPTDVLSFGQGYFHQGRRTESGRLGGVIGDLVISVETARRQAEERQHPLEHELRVLTVHGIVHLLGWDHVDDVEAEQMEAIERDLLAKLSPG
jgi:probable rRNA maturation factor